MTKSVLTESFNINENVKKRIKDAVSECIRDFQRSRECSTGLKEPVIGYVSAKHPLFMKYLDEDICLHPKAIYRPGNTVIIHFVPFERKTAESNRGGKEPSPEWTKAFYDSMHLSMKLNGIICDTLDEVGRLHSGTNIPTDWNEEKCREEWSHKLAAYAAGMGRFGIAGSFHTELGFAGRLGSILVDEHYASFEEKDLKMWDMEQVISHIKTDSKYKGAEDIRVSRQAIEACPGGAISKDGIDRKLCQARCRQINDMIPSPEVCGKCFFYDR